MSNTTTNANAGAAMTAQTLKLIKRGGAIYAPLPDEYTNDEDTILCCHNSHGEAVVPKRAGKDLDRCLYDLRNSSTAAGKLPDGTQIELDGRIIGHFESCHFIPAN